MAISKRSKEKLMQINNSVEPARKTTLKGADSNQHKWGFTGVPCKGGKTTNSIIPTATTVSKDSKETTKDSKKSKEDK